MERRTKTPLLNLSPSEFSIERELSDVLKEIEGQAQAAPGADPVIAAMSSKLFDLSTVDPLVAQGIENVVTFRNMVYGNQGASQVAGIIRSSIMTDQLVLGKRPYEWDSPDKWHDPITEFFEVATMNEAPSELAQRSDEITLNLNQRLVMTNPFTRAIGDELIMQTLYERRFPDGYQWIDIGSALLEIPKQILAKNQYPIDRVTIMDSLGGTVLRGTTEKANALLGQPHRIQQCVAVDLLDSRRDKSAWEWTHGSLRPREMSDPAFMCKFDGLSRATPEGLDFFTGDLLDEKNLAEFKSVYPSLRPNIVTLSTMLHQLKKKERDRMLCLSKELLTDDGIVVIKDFAYVQQKTPRSPRFYPNWHHPGRYRMLVLDKAEGSGKYHEMYHAKDSRNLVLAPGAGKIAVSEGKSLSFNQLIDSA